MQQTPNTRSALITGSGRNIGRGKAIVTMSNIGKRDEALPAPIRK